MPISKRHSVGTCLWHVSLQTEMYQRIGNMPKACPYVIMPPIVADINHRTCHAKGIRVSIYLPYWIIGFLKIGFSPKASGFYPFGDATALAGECGVGDVVWLIQASA